MIGDFSLIVMHFINYNKTPAKMPNDQGMLRTIVPNIWKPKAELHMYFVLELDLEKRYSAEEAKKQQD